MPFSLLLAWIFFVCTFEGYNFNSFPLNSPFFGGGGGGVGKGDGKASFFYSMK